MRRGIWCAAAGFAAILALAPAAAAELARPVTVVVPFPAGGPTDALARLLVDKVAPGLEVPISVLNVPGEAGNVAAARVKAAPADGSELLFGTSGTLATNPLVYDGLAYDPAADFEPILFVGLVPNVLLVRDDLPVRTVDDLVRYEAEGALTYGSPGFGSSAHLSGALLNHHADASVAHTGFLGTGPALEALTAGAIDMTFTDALTALPVIAAGEARPLAVSTAERSPVLPDVTTMVEAGHPEFAVSGLFGIVAPKGTPAPVLDRLNERFAAVLARPETVAELEARGLAPNGDMRPERLAEYLEAEVARWRALLAEVVLQRP